MPSIMLTKHNFPDNIKGFFIELNSRKSKWLLGGKYHPHPPSQAEYFFNTLDKVLVVYSDYENVLLIGDFNAHLDTFLYKPE